MKKRNNIFTSDFEYWKRHNKYVKRVVEAVIMTMITVLLFVLCLYIGLSMPY